MKILTPETGISDYQWLHQKQLSTAATKNSIINNLKKDFKKNFCLSQGLSQFTQFF